MSSESKRSWLWEFVLGVLLMINIGMTSWGLTNIVTLKSDVAAIQASRFSAKDGLEVWQAISDVRQQIASVPKDIPPKWFLEQFNELKGEVIANRTKQVQMEQKMDEILALQKRGQ